MTFPHSPSRFLVWPQRLTHLRSLPSMLWMTHIRPPPVWGRIQLEGKIASIHHPYPVLPFYASAHVGRATACAVSHTSTIFDALLHMRCVHPITAEDPRDPGLYS